MNIGAIILTFAICFVPIIVIFAMMPYIGRRTLTFGVSIPSGVHDDSSLKKLRKTFSRNVLLLGVLMSIISVAFFILFDTALAIGLMSGLVLLYILIIFFIYVRNFNAVKKLKSDKGWQEKAQSITIADTKFQKTKRSVSALWFLVYAIIIVGTILLGIILYDDMPNNVVMQTDMQGNVTRMVDKSYGVILFAPAMQAIMALVFGFIYWMMQKTPAVIDPNQPEISSKQNTKFRYRWSAFIVFGGMLLCVIFLFAQLGFADVVSREASIWIPLIATGIIVLGAIILAITTGQSGSRIRIGKQTDGKIIHRDDDRYWKWGLIYVNRNDPAMFVEKRFGVGFTINFGKPAAVAIFVGFLAVIIVIIILSTTLAS